MIVFWISVEPRSRGVGECYLFTRLQQTCDPTTFVSFTQRLSFKFISWWHHIHLVDHRWRPVNRLFDCRHLRCWWALGQGKWWLLGSQLLSDMIPYACLHFATQRGTTLFLAWTFIISTIHDEVIITHRFLIEQSKLRWEVHLQEQKHAWCDLEIRQSMGRSLLLCKHLFQKLLCTLTLI